jgi:hypothetical protein
MDKPLSTMMDREQIFKQIQNEDWDSLTAFLHKNKNDIKSDNLLQLAAKIFVTEFLKKTDEYADNKPGISANLLTLHMIHKGKYYILTEEEHKALVCRIVKWKKDDLSNAYNFAQMFPEEKICADVIKEYEKKITQRVDHSQTDKIEVTERTNISDVDYRINLFKSTQEIELFNALKQSFPNHHIYPNVAVSCLLDWEVLRHDLSNEEKNYFLKAIVDFVVFDHANGYIPIYFFELDSEYHDLANIKKKDELKDSIFSKAGVKLRRIRKQDKNINLTEFIKLIRDLTKQD